MAGWQKCDYNIFALEGKGEKRASNSLDNRKDEKLLIFIVASGPQLSATINRRHLLRIILPFVEYTKHFELKILQTSPSDLIRIVPNFIKIV